MKYITTINPTFPQYVNKDAAILSELIISYRKLLIDNKLSPYGYHPVINCTFKNDDLIKNRITLTIEAKPKSFYEIEMDAIINGVGVTPNLKGVGE